MTEAAWMRDAHMGTMYASYAVFRGALENASTATWLLASEQRAA